MGFGVALQVNDAELNIGVGEQALGDRQQAGEIILNDHQNAAEAPLNQIAENGFPILEVFAAELDGGREDLPFAVAPQGDDDIEASGAQLIAILDFDILAVDAQGQQIRGNRPAVAELEFFDTKFWPQV